jgi:hypothetical protein
MQSRPEVHEPIVDDVGQRAGPPGFRLPARATHRNRRTVSAP